MQKLKLTSPIPPSMNHYLSYRVVMKNGKPVAMSYKTQEAVKYQKQFCEYVKDEVKRQGYTLIPNKYQHFYIDAVFYFDRIDCDPNNYWKCLLDAITDAGVIWVDDNTTCERVQRIYYDTKNPRVDLEVYPVDYIGIFNNETQLAQFESNCFGCTRYKRNCSILQKAKEGKIQEEIQNLQCTKYKSVPENRKNNKTIINENN